MLKIPNVSMVTMRRTWRGIILATVSAKGKTRYANMSIHLMSSNQATYLCVTQVKIYKMFRILSMLDESKIERVGDVLEWVFRSAMKVILTVMRTNHC